MSGPGGTSMQQMALRKGKELEVPWRAMKIQSRFNETTGEKAIN